MRHAVVIASINRPDILGEALADLRRQTTYPDVVVVSVTTDADLPPDVRTTPNVLVVTGEPGLTKQRNRGIDALDVGVELVTFLDDDAVLADDYIEQAERFADFNPDVVLFDGRVAADGAVTGEISRENALQALANTEPDDGVQESVGAYGCNMNVRASLLEVERFDARLPGYGWLEDRDFTVRAGRHGRTATTAACVLVHRGVSGGRVSGLRLGFSQVVNPWYLVGKGTMTRQDLVAFWARALVGNAVGVLRPDADVDRAGRLRGNLRGLADVIRRRADPEALPVS